MARRNRPPPARPPAGGTAGPAPVRWAAETGHDLRQSLQAATLQAHVLALQAQQQAQADWVQLAQQMAQSLQHCQALLDSLLTSLHSRPAGPATAAPAPQWQVVDLGALLDALLQAWQPTAVQRGLQLSLQRPDPAPCVRSDALLLRRVLDNLVGNALANTPAGAVVLRLWPAADAGPSGPVLTVSDSGPGLASGAPAARANAPGHGLGLLIVRGLCGLLHIQVQWQAVSGTGTVVRLGWPAAPASA